MESLRTLNNCSNPLQELKENRSVCLLGDQEFDKLKKYRFNDYFKRYNGTVLEIAIGHIEFDKEQNAQMIYGDGRVQRHLVIKWTTKQGKIPKFVDKNSSLQKYKNKGGDVDKEELSHLFGRAIFNLGLIYDFFDPPQSPAKLSNQYDTI